MIGKYDDSSDPDSFSLQTDRDRRRRISRLRRIQRGEDVSDDEYEASSNPADDAYFVRYASLGN